MKTSKEAAALHRAGRIGEAEELYRRLLLSSPKDSALLTGLGTLMLQTGHPAEAVKWLDRSVKVSESQEAAWFALGFGLAQLGRKDEALQSYDRAIELNPGNPDAHYNRANLLRELDRQEEALSGYARTTAISPNHAVAYNNRGLTFHDLGRYDEALASFDRAIEIRGDYAVAYNNRGLTLEKLEQRNEALASFETAIRLNPNYPNAHYNRGNLLRDLERTEEALASFEQAIALKPDFASAHYNRGSMLQNLKRYDEALESYDRVIVLQPDHPALFGHRLHAKMHLCDWKDVETQFAEFENRIAQGQKISEPFASVAVSDSPSVQKMAAEIWANEEYPGKSGTIPAYAEHEKIRLGYFSADYHNHATAHLMAELFERHDRDRFELTAFSFGPESEDEMRQRLVRAFDRFIDVRAMGDEDAARLSREFEIDIAVDLKGYTQDSRAGIFAHRAAPIQASYLGYPGTMGAEFIDYLIADSTLIPEKHRCHYSEKIVHLPGSYQVNDTKRPISEKTLDRIEMGLPRDGFVFCCFNNNYKITPETFDTWMRMLEAVEGSVLWLYESNARASDNLRNEASKRGIAPERLVFAKHLPLSEHLARYRLADLFLDTFPCNAHTTASDALWAGLPVLTLMGETFASRVAASLLHAVHLPELVTDTREDYEALATELAMNPMRLKTIRKNLEEGKSKAPLFDIEKFTRNFENALIRMHERHRAGLPPDHIFMQS